MNWILRIGRSPYLNLISGLVLLVTSCAEIFDGFADPTVGLRHGTLVLGITQILRALPEIVEGAHELGVAEEQFHDTSEGSE